jgi:hypothetical protein
MPKRANQGMKPLLMHADRDFDPQQVLWEEVHRFRRETDQKRYQPAHEQALIQDLELETLLRAMASNDELVFEVARTTLLSGPQNNVDTILYRQEALKDCLKNEAVIREMYDLTRVAIETTRRRGWSLSSTYPSSLLYSSVDFLEFSLDMLKRLRGIAEERSIQFESKTFTTLFAMLRRELSDEYLASVQNHLAELKFRKGILVSAELGEWNESCNLMLCRAPDGKRNWWERILRKGPSSYTFRLHPRDEAGGRILSNMHHRGISRVAVALAQAGDHVLGFFKALQTELAFYVGCLNLRNRLVAKGEPICFPTPVPAGERIQRFSGLYDVCLSLQAEQRVVGNSVDADGKSLVIITGANQGGKSTFLRSIGLAQLMMQSGMFVGAESFRAELCPAVFTHYKREEDTTMTRGKFDEEIARMSEIADHITPNSLVLFNESFAATNEREGSEIARQVVSALLESRVKVFYTTHMYTFASDFVDKITVDALFLRAERKADGARTFKLREAVPLETSYGEDLYRRVFGPNERSLDQPSDGSALPVGEADSA